MGGLLGFAKRKLDSIHSKKGWWAGDRYSSIRFYILKLFGILVCRLLDSIFRI
ncbi:hypothetical protein DCO58_00840 [Helicobacter saguini]|uniref:Uncharacterized protein n=1 Tax=Helicobacter saguini TaxID=1548018 RepID=A0A6B0HRX1_9HELI|nr:hypothetical protein [Helicobacter saguini]MWV63065.1 hypothetical protein [Helicobacter saguini]MWV66266.1 hypothetical protein [Helicobacter saguini]MWV68618.1 hypothetical protein [Helicobacter saguini]MWV71831.1 hypothetical protein [Helicobacter saguini]